MDKKYSNKWTDFKNSLDLTPEELTEIDFSKCNFDTSKCEQISAMFYGCECIEHLDLSGFDTSRVKEMARVFKECIELKSINLGDNFDTSRSESFYEMFNRCEKLNEINLGDKFDTSMCETFDGMFYECENLKSLKLGDKFRIPNGSTICKAFAGLSKLNDIDFGKSWAMGNMLNNRHEITTFLIYSTELKRIKLRNKEYSNLNNSDVMSEILEDLVRQA